MVPLLAVPGAEWGEQGPEAKLVVPTMAWTATGLAARGPQMARRGD